MNPSFDACGTGAKLVFGVVHAATLFWNGMPFKARIGIKATCLHGCVADVNPF